MDQLLEKFRIGLTFITSLLERMDEDKALSSEELIELRECFESFVSAIEYEEACREEALQAAATQGREARTEI